MDTLEGSRKVNISLFVCLSGNIDSAVNADQKYLW